MFSKLIVATEAGRAWSGRRGVQVAASLARRRGLLVEVLSVVRSPDDRRAAERHPWEDFDGVDRFTVVEGDNAAAAIVEYVRNRDGVLLVMSTGATGLLSLARRSVTGQVLAELPQPVLFLGPEMADTVDMAGATLVAGVDGNLDSQPALPVIESWQRSFGGPRPWLVDIVAATAWPAGTTDDEVAHARLDTVVSNLAAHGIDAASAVLHGNEPVEALLNFSAEVDDPVFVLTSDRWAGARSHWYSTTRRMLRRSPRPVLVVPSDRRGY